MAILGKFEAQIFVDGVLAEEFDDDEEETPSYDQVTKYVEAVAGAHFEVKVLLDATYQFTEDAIAAHLRIDGEWGTGQVKERSLFSTESRYGRKSELNLNGRYSVDASGTTFYKFQFSNLETRDMEKTDDMSTFKDKYGQLGTIRVQLWRDATHGEMATGARGAKDVAAVPEKALKGRPLDVATRYVAATPPSIARTIKTEHLDKKPLATFHFKYRTRRALQALLILGRSPTPVPLENRLIEELSREEAVELLRREREQREMKQDSGLKRERSCTVTDAKSVRPLKSTKGNNGETIFHLDSEDDSDDGEIEEVMKPKRTQVEIVEL